jgi:hypothetical protein
LAVKLVLDDREWQEPILLQVEDGFQPLDITLRVEAVSPGGAGRVEKSLVLEVADLRYGEVGIEALEPLHDLADG